MFIDISNGIFPFSNPVIAQIYTLPTALLEWLKFASTFWLPLVVFVADFKRFNSSWVFDVFSSGWLKTAELLELVLILYIELPNIRPGKEIVWLITL